MDLILHDIIVKLNTEYNLAQGADITKESVPWTKSDGML